MLILNHEDLEGISLLVAAYSRLFARGLDYALQALYLLAILKHLLMHGVYFFLLFRNGPFVLLLGDIVVLSIAGELLDLLLEGLVADVEILFLVLQVFYILFAILLE